MKGGHNRKVVWIDDEPWTVKEIAERLNANVSTIRGRIRDGVTGIDLLKPVDLTRVVIGKTQRNTLNTHYPDPMPANFQQMLVAWGRRLAELPKPPSRRYPPLSI